MKKLALSCATAATLSLLAVLGNGWGPVLVNAAAAHYAGSHVSVALSPLPRAPFIRTALFHAALLPVPFAVWLGILAIRRTRDREPTVEEGGTSPSRAQPQASTAFGGGRRARKPA